MEDQTIKQDSGKARLSLVPQRINFEIASVREFGLTKYPEDSWRGVELRRYLDALGRHVSAMITDGIDSVAEDSGLYHASHAACNLAFILELLPRKEYYNAGSVNNTHSATGEVCHEK